MDKEHIILEEINENKHISQRQLAHTTELSLGSINLLLKKMIKEGLIKMESIPANRVAYMLTPKGMMEKANKTYKYIKHHYRAIEETKTKIKKTIIQLLDENKTLYVLLNQDEMSHITRTSIEELDERGRIQLFDEDKKIDDKEILLTVNNEDYQKYKKLYDRVVDLGERL